MFQHKKVYFKPHMQHCPPVKFCKSFHQAISSQCTQIRAEFGPQEFFCWIWAAAFKPPGLKRAFAITVSEQKWLALLLWLLLLVSSWATPKVTECTVALTVTSRACITLEQNIHENCRNREKYNFTLNYRKCLRFKNTCL